MLLKIKNKPQSRIKLIIAYVTFSHLCLSPKHIVRNPNTPTPMRKKPKVTMMNNKPAGNVNPYMSI
jgi:hypothetical protein